MRAMAQEFDIRLNALDFKDLQDKISRPIAILHNITFHRTLLDRFIDTFKEEVNKNPFYDTAEVSKLAQLLSPQYFDFSRLFVLLIPYICRS